MERVDKHRAFSFKQLLGDVRDEEFDVQAKLVEVSVTLCALMEHEGVSRAELAKRLNWIPSRITKVLSGEDNLTLKTLVKVLRALEYDFDVVMRRSGDARAKQPWEKSGLVLKYETRTPRTRGQRRELSAKDYRFGEPLDTQIVCANDSFLSEDAQLAA